MRTLTGAWLFLLIAGTAFADASPVARERSVQEAAPRGEESQLPRRTNKEVDLALRALEQEVETLRAALAALEAVVDSLAAVEEASEAAAEPAPVERVAAVDPERWSDCAWRVVGKAESHNPQSEWCSPGSFITRIDLGSGPAHKGPSFPIMERVECCRLGVEDTP